MSGSPDVYPCPICGGHGRFRFEVEGNGIYRCAGCSHAFTRVCPSGSFETYDRTYFEVTHRNWVNNPNYPLFKWICSKIPAEASSLLDVGCGGGDFLRFLRDHRPDLDLVGVDQIENSPEPGISFHRNDIMSFDPGRTYDVVVSLAVIEHLPDPSAFTRRLRQLASTGSGGAVVVMTLNEGGLVYFTARMAAAIGLTIARDRLYSRHHLHHFTRRSLRTCLEAGGLRVTTAHSHDMPIAAIDIPVTSCVADAGLRAVVAGIFTLSAAIGGGFLQTMVAVHNASE